MVHVGASGCVGPMRRRRNQQVGWRIYVNYTDDQNGPVDGRPHALGQHRVGAGAATAVISDTIVADALIVSADD